MSETPSFSEMLKPAALGGLLTAFLIGVPILNLGNLLCCLWVQIGGVVAVALLLKQREGLITGGTAAAVGALSGVVGGLVGGLCGFLLTMVLQGAQMGLMANSGLDITPEMLGLTAAGGAIGLVRIPVMTVVYTAFAALGGFLGLTLFFKDRAA